MLSDIINVRCIRFLVNPGKYTLFNARPCYRIALKPDLVLGLIKTAVLFNGIRNSFLCRCNLFVESGVLAIKPGGL